MENFRRTAACLVLGVSAMLGLLVATLPLRAAEPIHLNIVGGLDGVSQYTKHEAPFWREELARRSRGAIVASIRPFNRSGLPGSEMLNLLKSGVVAFGTTLLSRVAGDEPMLSALDLPGLNPDIATLRRTVSAFRPFMEKRLLEHYDLVLLGVYTYPAQVLFCEKAMTGFSDLAGRRIRTSAVSQSEFVAGLGAMPVILPFSDIVSSISRDVVDCAITGTRSGNEIGLSKVTMFVHDVAINWGVSVFAANRGVWMNLPEESRKLIAESARALEQQIWEGAEHETANGLACNTGAAFCEGGRRDRMQLVRMNAQDDAIRRKLLVETALPAWLSRCGQSCAGNWNTYLAPVTGIRIGKDRAIEDLGPGKLAGRGGGSGTHDKPSPGDAKAR